MTRTPSQPERQLQRPCTTRTHAGFSLVELLVVVSLIALLIGLGGFAFFGLRTEGSRQQTMGILQRAQGVATEYQATAGQQVNHGGTSPISWNTVSTRLTNPEHPNYDPDNDSETPPPVGSMGDSSDPNDYVSIERFVWAAQQVPAAARSVNNFKVLRERSDGSVQDGLLRDLDNDGFLEIVDGWAEPLKYFARTTSGEFGEGVPAHRQPFFASAGADGEWGTYTADGPDAEAEDNLFSFNLD